MKKLFLLAMIGMISTFTSCSNSNDEAPKQEETVASQKAEDLVRNSRELNISGKPIKMDNSVYVQCNTDWMENWGTSCIWSGGMLFKVSWSGVNTPGGMIYSYSTTATSFCTCGS